MGYKFGERSRQKMIGVHFDLVRVFMRAIKITPVDFTITCGLRSIEEQERLVASGRSRTMKSRHLTGHAIDFAPWVRGGIDWNNHDDFCRVADAIKEAAQGERVKVEWGGDWKGGWDKPHFQLPWFGYPANQRFDGWTPAQNPNHDHEPPRMSLPGSTSPNRRIPGQPERMQKRRRPGTQRPS